MNDHSLGALGISATASGAAVSMLPMIEQWLRIASLGVGIAVGLLTLALLVRRWIRGQDGT